LADEVAGGQLVNPPSGNRGIKREVEVLQRPGFAEGGGLLAAGDLPLFADMELILENQLKEFRVRQPVGFGFLQS
jgi:hypothetical protein